MYKIVRMELNGTPVPTTTFEVTRRIRGRGVDDVHGTTTAVGSIPAMEASCLNSSHHDLAKDYRCQVTVEAELLCFYPRMSISSLDGHFEKDISNDFSSTNPMEESETAPSHDRFPANLRYDKPCTIMV